MEGPYDSYALLGVLDAGRVGGVFYVVAPHRWCFLHWYVLHRLGYSFSDLLFRRHDCCEVEQVFIAKFISGKIIWEGWIAALNTRH